MNDILKEFKSYASDKIPSLVLDKQIRNINSITPYILEEREMRMTQMDVFSRLLKDRIIWLSGVIDQYVCDIVQAQLIFLDSVDNKDITMHINSPGGSVVSGLGIIDVMNYIKTDVATINTGLAASMGAVLLSAGAKGKRSSLIYSKTMIHQVSSGSHGVIEDTRIDQLESEKYNYLLFKIISKNCGKPFYDVLETSRRDNWLNSKETLEFGLIDEIIGANIENSIENQLDGFNEYYEKEVLKRSCFYFPPLEK